MQCCSFYRKAMAGTSSNKYHLCHQQVWLVVGPNQHQPNRQPCHTCTCAATGLMQSAYLGPDKVCLAGPLELQPSTVAGTKTCKNGALPKAPTGHSKCRARQHTMSQWHIPGLTSSAEHLSPVASFTSAKEKLTTWRGWATSKLRCSAIWLPQSAHSLN